MKGQQQVEQMRRSMGDTMKVIMMDGDRMEHFVRAGEGANYGGVSNAKIGHSQQCLFCNAYIFLTAMRCIPHCDNDWEKQPILNPYH